MVKHGGDKALLSLIERKRKQGVPLTADQERALRTLPGALAKRAKQVPRAEPAADGLDGVEAPPVSSSELQAALARQASGMAEDRDEVVISHAASRGVAISSPHVGAFDGGEGPLATDVEGEGEKEEDDGAGVMPGGAGKQRAKEERTCARIPIVISDEDAPLGPGKPKKPPVVVEENLITSDEDTPPAGNIPAMPDVFVLEDWGHVILDSIDRDAYQGDVGDRLIKVLKMKLISHCGVHMFQEVERRCPTILVAVSSAVDAVVAADDERRACEERRGPEQLSQGSSSQANHTAALKAIRQQNIAADRLSKAGIAPDQGRSKKTEMRTYPMPPPPRGWKLF